MRALLWSKSQNCFHVEDLAETVETNLLTFVMNGEINDFHPIAFGTEEQVRLIAEKYRPLLQTRE